MKQKTKTKNFLNLKLCKFLGGSHVAIVSMTAASQNAKHLVDCLANLKLDTTYSVSQDFKNKFRQTVSNSDSQELWQCVLEIE